MAKMQTGKSVPFAKMDVACPLQNAYSVRDSAGLVQAGSAFFVFFGRFFKHIIGINHAVKIN